MKYFVVPLFVTTLAVPVNASAQETPSARGTSAHQVGDFAAIDTHADTTPAGATGSVTDLAVYLSKAGPDDITRARAIYRWLTVNIEYDVGSLHSGDFGDVTPSGVLRNRTSVCSGYAGLAVALGKEMGLDIEIVNGWSKGYGSFAGQVIDGPTNHAWNAVRIDGQWQLMDPTWGAGHLNQQSQFIRRFQEHYFLTDPEIFVFDHFPDDDRWQLLDRTISRADFSELAYLQPVFFSAGLSTRSHNRVLIATENQLTVTLGVSKPVQMTAQVLDGASQQPLNPALAFVQLLEQEAQIHAVFPRSGEYLLRIFARPPGDERPLEWALDYRVHASQGSPHEGFPTQFATFGEKGVWLIEPFEGTLETGRSYRFRLRVPGAIQVAAVNNGEWTFFTGEGNDFSAEVPVAAGTTLICAQYDAADQCKGLLQYASR